MKRMTYGQFNDCIHWLRAQAFGKSFATHPELFKDIESMKAKKVAVFGSPMKTATR